MAQQVQTIPRAICTLVFLSALTLSLVGCKRRGEPFATVPSSVPPVGWTIAKDVESGIVLSIPAGWRIGMPGGNPAQATDATVGTAPPSVTGVTTDANGMDSLLLPDMEKIGTDPQEFRRQYAEYRIQREKARLVELRRKGIMLQAVDDARMVIVETPTRFYVQEYKGAGNLEAMKSQEKELLFDEGEGEAVTLPVGRAWMYRDQGQNRIGDVVCRISYLLCDGETGYALRFVSTNNPTVFDAFHRQVAKSVRKAKPSNGRQ